MTILAVIDDPQNNVIWVGSNGRATLGNLVGPSVDKKWFAREGWLIGITGSGPKLEALSAMSEDFPKDTAQPFEIVQFMKKTYDGFDIGESDDGLKRYCGSGLLVHKSGAAWDFDNSFCLTEIPSGDFWAQGSGMDIAIGAAEALKPYGLATKELVTRVVEVTTAKDVDCPGEVIVQSFDRNGVLSAPVS